MKRKRLNLIISHHLIIWNVVDKHFASFVQFVAFALQLSFVKNKENKNEFENQKHQAFLLRYKLITLITWILNFKHFNLLQLKTDTPSPEVRNRKEIFPF